MGRIGYLTEEAGSPGGLATLVVILMELKFELFSHNTHMQSQPELHFEFESLEIMSVLN